MGLSGINKAYGRTLLATAERYLATYGAFTFSSVTVMEVVRGYYLAARPERLTEFIASLADQEILAFTESTAELAGKIDADLLKSGQPIRSADPMIAETAIEHNLDLVTGNVKHFERIAALGYPLRLENAAGMSSKLPQMISIAVIFPQHSSAVTLPARQTSTANEPNSSSIRYPALERRRFVGLGFGSGTCESKSPDTAQPVRQPQLL